MATVPDHPMPGGMTVPPWFGWETLLTVLLVLVVVAVVFVVLSSTTGGRDERSEWQAWLDGRSGARRSEDRPGLSPDRPRDRPGPPG
jgi:hypothetical protein